MKYIDASSSKQEEIDFIRKVASHVKEGSYLASFFRPKLLNWIETQIRDDLYPDIWDCVQYYCKRSM